MIQNKVFELELFLRYVFLSILFRFVYLCVCVQAGMTVHAHLANVSAWGGQRYQIPLELKLGLQMILSFLTEMLGTELGTSPRAASTLNH